MGRQAFSAYLIDYSRDGSASFPGFRKFEPLLCKISFQDSIPEGKRRNQVLEDKTTIVPRWHESA